LRTALSQGPRLVGAALRTRRIELLALALDLCVPPFSLLMVCWLAALLISVAAGALAVCWGWRGGNTSRRRAAVQRLYVKVRQVRIEVSQGRK
ncbi:MAG: hypothetical protein WED87_01385, partial [Dehalococcoidia bacterium]